MSPDTLRIRTVESRADLARFIEYPFEKYRDDPHWVPPLRLAERQKFDPRKNPFYEHARLALFLAYRAGEVVGRVAAIDDDNHNRTHGDDLIFFGFFEADDAGVAEALFARVEDWGRGLGRNAVRGPANPSMNDGAGFQVDAFGTDPYVMMPYNPPEYPRYAEAAGYRKAKDLYAWRFLRGQKPGEKIGRLAARVRARHADLTVRPADMGRFEEELALVKQLYNDAWEKNWGFVKYTEAEFEYLARELKPIVDPDLILFAEVRGRPVGLALCLPDANRILKPARGRLLPFGVVAFLLRRRLMDRLRLPILGLLPEHRNRGIELVLIDELYRRGMTKRYRSYECSWVLEDNRPMNRILEATGATLYKTYRIYQKEI